MWQGYPRFVHIGLCFELGLINDAEQLAHESLELFGSHPMTLKQLALINIAKGQTDTACIFLNALILQRYKSSSEVMLPADDTPVNNYFSGDYRHGRQNDYENQTGTDSISAPVR